MKRTYLILALLLTYISACDIINPDEEIPSFLEIQPFEFNGQGGSTLKITDAWVYVNGEFLGAFELPKEVPVLASGSVDLIIDPGIKENGISATPGIYPLYERFTATVYLNAGETLAVIPETQYKSEVVSFFQEDFNGGSSRFSDLEVTTIDVGEGSASGYYYLDQDDAVMSIKSDALEFFPEQGALTYLEMDYKADIPIFVGMTAYTSLGEVTFTELTYGLNTKEVWNKVYFDFTEVLSLIKQANAARYEIRISAQIPIDNGVFTRENAEIRLDNIKLLTF